MRVKVEDTGQLTSCFNESEGRRYRSNLLRVLMRVKVKIQVNLLRVLMRVKVKDTGQLTSCFNESEGKRYRSTNFVF